DAARWSRSITSSHVARRPPIARRSTSSEWSLLDRFRRLRSWESGSDGAEVPKASGEEDCASEVRAKKDGPQKTGARQGDEPRGGEVRRADGQRGRRARRVTRRD